MRLKVHLQRRVSETERNSVLALRRDPSQWNVTDGEEAKYCCVKARKCVRHLLTTRPLQNILDVYTNLHSLGNKISFDKGKNLKCADNYNLFTKRILLPYPGLRERIK